jgi:hypothetical protein
LIEQEIIVRPATGIALISPCRSWNIQGDRVLAQRSLQQRVALVVPHMLVLPAIIASTDSIIDEIDVFELPIAQRPPCGINLSPWTVSMLWSQLSYNDKASR